MKKGKKLDAGMEVDSRCLKCKLVTNHTIIAMVGDQIAKVQCNVCGSRHNFRPSAPAKTGRTSRRTVRKSASGSRQKADKAQLYFEELMSGRDPAAAVPYDMNGLFQENDIVDHSHFGLGVVTATIPPNKIEVAFKEGSKILICGSEIQS